jgi:hypothetical protein
MRQSCAIALLGLAFTTGLVAADVLVTTDGSVVETDGPWQQRGKMVVFKLENGQLSALRAADVDFDATARWQAELADTGEAPSPAAPAAPAKARVVLTDADVAHSSPALEEPSSEAAGAGEASGPTSDSAADPSTQSAVRVTTWDEEEPADGRGRRIFGTLRNDGDSFATDIGVEVTVYDDDGAIAGVGTTPATVTSLRPGESSTFSLQFPEVYVVGATRFRVTSLDLDLDRGGETAPGDS